MATPKGVSGNPKGRPPGRPNPSTQVGWARIADIREYAKQWTEEAVDVTVSIMRDVSAPPSSRLAAAQAIIDRGWGKAVQAVDATVNTYERMSDAELIKIVEATVIKTGPDSGRVEFEDEPDGVPE